MADPVLKTLGDAVTAAKSKDTSALTGLLKALPPRDLFEVLRLATTKAGTSAVRAAGAPILSEALKGKSADELLAIMGKFDEASLGPEDAAAAQTTAAAAAPKTEAPLIERDICIIGGGVSGAIIARDAGSCGYTSVLVEMRHAVGGVWERTNYPGLRLHGFSSAYRCLSLVPPWQVRPHPVEGDHVGDIMYRPTCVELREYIEDMVKHEKIDVRLNMKYVGHQHDEDDPSRIITSIEPVSDGDSGLEPPPMEERGAPFRVRSRALVFATGANETLSGPPLWPFDPKLVKNGACVMHAADMTERRKEFDAGEKKYLVGASKSATDILQALDPEDDTLTWAHRGHIVMNKRAAAGYEDALKAPWPIERIRSAAMGNALLKSQSFKAHANLVIDSGVAHRVGLPRASLPESRGGTASVEEMEHARKFLKRQVILDACSVNDKGEVVLRCQDGRPEIVVGPNDSIVFCTGQRNDQGFKLYTEAANLNKDGVFMCLPYSTNTPTNAVYVNHELVSYLDGRPCAYTDGRFHAKLKGVVTHMANVKLTGAWALCFAFMGSVQADICGEILDYEKFRCGDLGQSYLTTTTWFGNSMDFRKAIWPLTADASLKGSLPPPPKPMSALTPDAWPVNTARAFSLLAKAQADARARLATMLFPPSAHDDSDALPPAVLTSLDPSSVQVLRDVQGYGAVGRTVLETGGYFSRVLQLDISWVLAEGLDKHAAISAVARAMPKLEQLSCRGLVANLPPLRAKKALDGFAMGDAIVSPGGKKPGGGGGGETAEKLLRAAVVCCAVAWSEVLVQLDLKDVMNAPQAKKETPLSLVMALAAAIVACPSAGFKRVKLHHMIDLNIGMMRAEQKPDGSTLNEHNYEGGWNNAKLTPDNFAMLVGVMCPPAFNSTVARLYLGNNGLDSELMLLSGALEKGHLPHLCELGLSNNAISPGTFATLAIALGRVERPDFCVLGASNNAIGNIGCQALFTVLGNGGLNGIMGLYLEANAIGDQGFEKMVTVLNQTKLQWFHELRLAGNSAQPRSVKQLTDTCHNRPDGIPALTGVDPTTNPLYDAGHKYDIFGGRTLSQIPKWEGTKDDPDTWQTVFYCDDPEISADAEKMAAMRKGIKDQCDAHYESLPEEEKKRLAGRVKSAPELWNEAGVFLAEDPGHVTEAELLD